MKEEAEGISVKPVHRVLGSSVILLSIVILGVVGVSAYFGKLEHDARLRDSKTLDFGKLEHDARLRDSKTLEIVVANLRVINEMSVVSDIVREKLPKLTPDQTSRIAQEICDGCRRHSIPVYLVLGLIEKESNWNPNAFSSAGATGLMQIMVETAIPLFRAAGEIFSLDKLRDPVRNVALGIQVLVDKYDAAIALGKAPAGDWTRALYHYNGGGESYSRLVLEKSVYYKRRLDTPLQDKLKMAEIEQVPVVKKK